MRPDQTLKFEPQLTVVFGDNASGKSGRMVSNVYRARVVDEILGDVRSDVPAEGERSATFTVKTPRARVVDALATRVVAGIGQPEGGENRCQNRCKLSESRAAPPVYDVAMTDTESVTFTREQLYELVWQRPIARLAEEYSISNVGLAKICTRSGIPTPPRGYWALVEAGRAPARPRLPATKDVPMIRLTMRSPEASDGRDEPSARPADKKIAENRITVPDRLHSPCALVQAARAALLGAKGNSLGFVEPPPDCLAIRVSREQLPRALRVADALLKVFAERGWAVAISGERTFVHVDEMPIALRIEEGTEADERPVKPELTSSYSFHHERRDIVRRPSGHLSISIREESQLWGHAQRRNWNESDKRSIEDCLTAALVGMIKLAEAMKAERARKEGEARKEEERRRRLQAAAEEQQRLHATVTAERSRVTALREQAKLWCEAQNLRGFVDEARKRSRGPEPALQGPDLDRWAEWALAQADRLDPFVPSPPSILDDTERIERLVDEARGIR